ncbi:BON domain-containing protein [Nostoc sp. UCD121]|uniref:BON domain-containing protein n=1 Tax=unclassified Nostoc TaxID=2593658 RepID=UPI00162A5D54|nr:MULTISPECIES: BON domain-containing protein [unclassified Nostoc]MBC1224371.1 BON domain-containing protein [Nostoc sp. UCD120]MBC1280332.1 BON domain-containing protein [Nostoc sp. UCD121]MBC1297427.1 BON domain-containing protein [Nostoc sp. UCD122]
MKKLTPFLISTLLVFGVAACDNASKTSESAPNNPNEAPQSPSVQTTEASQKDAQSETRRRQLDADIRAREQRNNVTGGDTDRAKGDLSSQVRSKLEANIPKGQLTVDATQDGVVTVGGTVNNQQELAKIERLAKEIKGVKTVVVKATVAPPTN